MALLIHLDIFFLVGGPGNGKSEAVEVFLRELDTLANSQGELINTVAQKFSLDPISPRRVEITSSELQETILQERIRRLIIIQDDHPLWTDRT